MSLYADILAFLAEHRRCGEINGGVEGDRVWLACDGCGAILARPAAEESPSLEA